MPEEAAPRTGLEGAAGGRVRPVDERRDARREVLLDAVGLGLGEAAVGDGLLELCLLGRDECVDEPWATCRSSRRRSGRASCRRRAP